MIQLSIIIPAYNAQATLARTLGSLETIPPSRRGQVQVVAVNDGSTDQTPALLHQAADRGGGFSWDVIDQANGGLSHARNVALARARGDWAFLLDADDELLFDPVLLSAQAGPETTCLGLSVEYAGGRGLYRVHPRQIDPKNFLRVFSALNPFQPSSLLFRSDRIDRPFDRTMRSLEDWFFWMENPRIFTRMALRPDTLAARVHIHGGNMTSKYDVMGLYRAKIARAMLDSHPGLPQAVRNNFAIQERIGALQQGARFPGRALWAWPCDPVLYAKLWVYFAAALTGRRATRF